MRLEIDWTRCDRHGLCAELMPERFTRDEWGFPLIATKDVGTDEAKDIRRVVGMCPALALRLEAR